MTEAVAIAAMSLSELQLRTIYCSSIVPRIDTPPAAPVNMTSLHRSRDTNCTSETLRAESTPLTCQYDVTLLRRPKHMVYHNHMNPYHMVYTQGVIYHFLGVTCIP